MKLVVPGINVQWPWSNLIANGQKKIETRKYSIPEKHLGEPLALIETPGRRGKREAGIIKARIIGIVVFERAYPYQTRDHWLEEQYLHKIPIDDPLYRFELGIPKWAWVVKSFKPLRNMQPAPKKRGIVFASRCTVFID